LQHLDIFATIIKNKMLGSGWMKKIVFLIFITILAIIQVQAVKLPGEVSVTADAVILYDLDNNDVVYEKNANKQEILASLTKMMTAYTIIERVSNLYQKVTITEEDLYALWGFTLAGLEVGDVVSYKELLYAMMLPSGADASQALAIHAAGSTEKFTDWMNEEAQKLGLSNTHFEDSYGGDDNNVSTAREYMRFMRIALQNETFKQIFETTYYTLSTGLQVINYTRSLATFHGLDSELITGNKSGYTPEAGLLLASTATINGTHYALIVMNCDVNDWKSTHVLETYQIYDYIADKTFQEYTLISKGQYITTIPVTSSSIDSYVVNATKDLKMVLSDEDYAKVTYEYHIIDELTSEYGEGDNIGYIDVLIDGEVIDTYNIFLREDITGLPIERSSIVIILIIILVICIIILFLVNLFTYPKKIRV